MRRPRPVPAALLSAAFAACAPGAAPAGGAGPALLAAARSRLENRTDSAVRPRVLQRR